VSCEKYHAKWKGQAFRNGYVGRIEEQLPAVSDFIGVTWILFSTEKLLNKCIPFPFRTNFVCARERCGRHDENRIIGTKDVADNFLIVVFTRFRNYDRKTLWLMYAPVNASQKFDYSLVL
jgi:hypothetical protein